MFHFFCDEPYIFPDEPRTAKWRHEFALAGQKLRVGIAWQGNPKHRWDRHRSFSLEYFQPLAKLGDVQLYSLQKALPWRTSPVSLAAMA